MDYQSYRQYRDEYLKTHSPLRLDCMNPVKSLNFLQPKVMPIANTSLESALSAWVELTGTHKWLNRAFVGEGVRDLLSKILRLEVDSQKELLLPDDVYPVYWELAEQCGFAAQGFSTFPQLDLLTVLQREKGSVLVLPNPLVPAGRFLSDVEVGAVRAWLKENSTRRLILDSVYLFGKEFPQASLELFSEGQTYLLHSLSKSWLEPEALGVALCPEGATLSQSGGDASRALAKLQASPSLPIQLQEVYNQQWAWVESFLRRIDPTWRKPETGYFSFLNRSFDSLLKEHSILTVPASVFGSPAQNVSIVTCLYYGLQNPQEKTLGKA